MISMIQIIKMESLQHFDVQRGQGGGLGSVLSLV